MTFVICAEQDMFAIALTEALSARGARVVTVPHPQRAAGLPRESGPHVCVLIPRAGNARLRAVRALRRVAPDTAVVLLLDQECPGMWAAFDDGTVDALVSVEVGLETLETTLVGVAAGRRLALGVRRGTARSAYRAPMTAREFEVLRMIVAGSSTCEMSHALDITTNTVRSHVQHVLDKLGVPTRLEAARKAIDEELLEIELEEAAG